MIHAVIITEGLRTRLIILLSSSEIISAVLTVLAASALSVIMVTANTRNTPNQHAALT